MAPGETTTPADSDDDLAARLADPVLAGALAEPPPPDDPPEVWGRLGEPDPVAGEDAPLDRAAVEARARALLDEMTVHEKLHLLSGDTPLVRGLAEAARGEDRAPYVAGEMPRLGVPGVRLAGGRRGVGGGRGTAFPVPMARGATFDPDLEEQVGDAIGVECRAFGANLFAGVCVDLVRHPGWARAHETFGEDPHLLGEMGAALVRGTQRHVMACVGHLVGHASEDGRFTLDVAIDDDDLRDIHLPPFRRCVEAGAAAVMAAGHRLNGTRCGHHHRLVTGVLKDEWGFDGFVVSDLVLGARSARAVVAGLDLEVPFHWRFRALPKLVRRGRLGGERVDDAALRLLRQQVRFAAQAARTEGDERDGAAARARYAPSRVAGGAHRALARQVAERSIVLLRNEMVRAVDAEGRGAPGGVVAEPVLPLDPEQVESLAVLGHLAAQPLTGDAAGAHPLAPAPVTVLDGLRAAGDRRVINVSHDRGDDLDAARLAAAAADVAVVVAGLVPRGDGRDLPLPWPRRAGADRRSLSLHPHDEALIRTVGAANPRSVVVLVAGSAVVTDAWREQVGALLVAWYPGAEGGHALARALFGEVNPGGRLPCTWPRGTEQLPPFDPGAQAARYGPLHGYRLMQATGRPPAFPFGFGLSYTTFEHGRLVARQRWDGVVHLTVPVVNTGTREGDEVVQVYLDEPLGSDPRPLRTLRAFRRVTVAPGSMANVTFELGPPVLARTAAAHGGRIRLHVGRDADPRGHRTVEA